MREILYKAKRIDNGEWVEGYCYANEFEDGIYHCIIHKKDTNTFTVDSNTISQYTGLKDKNGNKIFENDIVKLNYIEVREFNGVKYDFKTEFIEEVVFYNGAFQYHLKAEEIDYYRHIVNLPLDKVKVESVEVLGNIFDNKELLGE